MDANQQAAYESAYLDKKRFPLTNRQNLPLDKQRMLDAVNMDDLREMRERGDVLTPELQAIAQEFEEKAKLRQMLAPAAPVAPTA